jgi:hypothetical protein
MGKNEAKSEQIGRKSPKMCQNSVYPLAHAPALAFKKNEKAGLLTRPFEHILQ